LAAFLAAFASALARALALRSSSAVFMAPTLWATQPANHPFSCRGRAGRQQAWVVSYAGCMVMAQAHAGLQGMPAVCGLDRALLWPRAVCRSEA
jgi:ferric-dicitrate binding protein FerR (iron transport regulator)